MVRRYIEGFASGEEGALDELYTDNAVFTTPFARFDGREQIKAYARELHEAFPGFSLALHDEFSSADGARAALRQTFRFEHTGSFRGRPATGRSGATIETHSLELRDGRIAVQIAGASTFHLPQLLLVDLELDFPRDLPDLRPEIFSASPGGSSEPVAESDSPATRFVDAFGRRDQDALDRVYAEDVELYTPLGWPVRGRDALRGFADEFHASNPGLRIALHDEFYSADGSRACWRIRLHYHNTAPFFGNPATGDAGVMTETHSVTLRDGRIIRQVVGDASFHMPYQELVLWGMEFPTDTPDPDRELMAASARTREAR